MKSSAMVAYTTKPSSERWKQKDNEFKINLNYIPRPYPKNPEEVRMRQEDDGKEEEKSEPYDIVSKVKALSDHTCLLVNILLFSWDTILVELGCQLD